ncbi:MULTISPECIES: Tat proofreading chaperone DmsD [Providencia]|uniref:Tat proofreading chaperone DmsD n=1 Tax=Providencia TaxID=586 RepID=UPI001BD61B0D|nr:Tat proofreading chaperone DmsD [Providencia rettgeri]ELR5071006.1 Tat proofreading chaperone DmsD [Providencia rettgeri]ELR5072999.1 Tat proofreading chaperone DmsD [Providencia stuartii]ELR5221733.1 Tat proofreading chaperone DmsD [Providencia rettgeri]MDX7321786.1 Tat proofreading chaperone DmsD [Providencia rettgeri]
MEQKLLADFSLCAQTLGALFYYDPSDVRVNTLIDLFTTSEWLAEWPFTQDYDCQSIDKLFQDSLSETETLQEAYQRLFIGPYALPAPPWGSVYLDKENVIFGISTLELRAWLRNNQINIELNQKEPEDHVGLLFLLTAWVIENKPELLREFLEVHFLPWIYRYLEKMQLQSGNAFYVASALLATETLKHIQQAVQLNPVNKEICL